MPSQLVKCAFGFRSFNDPKTKYVPLSLELGSEQGAHAPGAPPYVVGPGYHDQFHQRIERIDNFFETAL